VGLWRSWERASMAWKRSSVRSRPGPPTLAPALTPRLICIIKTAPLALAPELRMSHAEGSPPYASLSTG
jgi:hypothetical protein